MTVCVATFAAKSQAIVMISDKALSFGDMVSDANICKMSQIGDSSWHALISGEISLGDEIIMESAAELTKKLSDADSMATMMRLVSKAYSDVYQRHLTARTLTSKLLTREDVFNRARKLIPVPDALLKEIAEDRKKFEKEWGCSLIVCGFDAANRANIFSVVQPGEALSENKTGFAATGVGANAAIGRLLFLETSRDNPLDQVIFEAFDAKVQAEIIQFVSYTWDAYVIFPPQDKNRAARPLPEKTQKMLDNVFVYLNRSPFEKERWKKDEMPPKNWKGQLKRACEALVMP